MKSLAELQAIRDRAKMAVNVRENSEAKTRVLVGMATCGIAAGARPVLTAISVSYTHLTLPTKRIV